MLRSRRIARIVGCLLTVLPVLTLRGDGTALLLSVLGLLLIVLSTLLGGLRFGLLSLRRLSIRFLGIGLSGFLGRRSLCVLGRAAIL